jgi:SAM-dependent methyltransferase
VSEVGLYSDPEVYDILHWPGTAAEFRGLERGARRHVRTRSARWTVLEPACGTGRLLRPAARRGHRALGFDLSAAMVEYAQERLPKSGGHRAFVADMTRFAGTLGRTRVDLAFCPINTVRHLLSDAAMLAHFAEMARVLKWGGVYLVGIGTTVPGLETVSEDVWKGSRGRSKVTQVVTFFPPARGRLERVHSHLIVERDGEREHRDSTYRLRTYSLAQWEALIERSALKVLGVVDAEGKVIKAPTLGYGVWALGARG